MPPREKVPAKQTKPKRSVREEYARKGLNPTGAPVGNSNAKRGSMFRDAIRKALAESPEALMRIARSIVRKAEKGDEFSINTIADRLDGKPKPMLMGDGDEDGVETFTFVIQRAVADRRDDS